jgi:hypothetical protein
MNAVRGILGGTLALAVPLSAQTAPRPTPGVKAPVGDTLSDASAGPRIQNHVVPIDGERTSAVWSAVTLAVPAGMFTAGLRYVALLQQVDIVIKHGARIN